LANRSGCNRQWSSARSFHTAHAQFSRFLARLSLTNWFRAMVSTRNARSSTDAGRQEKAQAKTPRAALPHWKIAAAAFVTSKLRGACAIRHLAHPTTTVTDTTQHLTISPTPVQRRVLQKLLSASPSVVSCNLGEKQHVKTWKPFVDNLPNTSVVCIFIDNEYAHAHHAEAKKKIRGGNAGTSGTRHPPTHQPTPTCPPARN
jgi:hypothetical protein